MSWRTAAGKILYDEAFNIAKNPKHDGYLTGPASVVYIFFRCWQQLSGGGNNSENMPNQQWGEKLLKLIVRNFEKRKVY